MTEVTVARTRARQVEQELVEVVAFPTWGALAEVAAPPAPTFPAAVCTVPAMTSASEVSILLPTAW